MTTIAAVCTALLVMLTLVSAAQAQNDAVNVQFRLTVTGEPCPDATYYAVFGVPQSEFFSDQLTDSDGDGVYTLSRQLGASNPLYISIQQGIGSVQVPPSLYLLPGPPRSTIRDFGLVTPTQDMTFEASVTGCSANGPSTLPDTGVTNYLLTVVLASSVLLASGAYLCRRIWLSA
jgi:hypothetical protein